MAVNLKTFFRLLGAYARMDLAWFLRDTKYCLLFMLADGVSALAAVTGTLLLSAKLGGFGGLSQDQVLFMLGFALGVEGVFSLFFVNNNADHISRIIGRGQLDHVMIMPVPLPIHLFTHGFAPCTGVTTLLVGVGMLTLATIRLDIAVTPLWVLTLIGCLLLGVSIIFSVIYIISSLAFYAPAAAEEIAGTAHGLFSMKGYPLGNLPPLWQGLLCTVVPVGAVAYLPARALLGQGGLVGAVALVAAVFGLTAFICFRRGLRHYARIGCSRYLPFGHRS